ncbi:hypothetical protein K437DRAFT_255643 [Tilletiaria anomala UBC 951]|uniref:Galactose-binding like protein n=1 Tax=Tilletiaria anomala (strain ATCC 24038 / CBS 436.72 / UBC 951) TaxID=1037660 RepID=A0A066W6N9_TILAU|nr:uncharacterized protein K437DRAFT_255643 [Tilletiaria anomala UBC 951]KDN48213.1 hypothetical protein K437DRAFT_255643 [Tilletiaria anomala UBC 951]
MPAVNLFGKGTLVKASSGLSREAYALVDGSPETSWTSAGSPSSEADPSSARHSLTFTLRSDVDTDDNEGLSDAEEDETAAVQLQKLESLVLTFQGGYSALGVLLLAKAQAPVGVGEEERSSWHQLAEFWPEDSNARQEFLIPPSKHNSSARILRLLLNGSADGFGRITLYGVELYGSRT